MSFQTFYNEKERIWSGIKKELYYDFDCSVGRVIYEAMHGYPKTVCQINDNDGRTLTNGEALTWAIRIAQHFKKMGLRHDDVIGIVAKNSTYLMPMAVACFLNCTPFHAVSYLFDEKMLRSMYELTKPKVIFCDGDVYEKVHAATSHLKPKIYTLTDHVEGVPKVEDLLEPTQTERFYKPEPLVLGGEQTVAILCSSGTTGMPKAVCISNHALKYDNHVVTSEDVVYNSSSLDWMTGIFYMLCSAAFGATRIISNRSFSPEHFVEIVKKYKVTVTLLPPRHAVSLLTCPEATSENLSSIRAIFVGGGAISLQSLKDLKALLNRTFLTFGYGLTEFAGIAVNYMLDHGLAVGKLLAGIRARIVDENGKNLGPNEVGEILVHNGLKWNGYYGNPEASARMQDKEGWFHTGDMGYFDNDNFLYMVDRKKDTLKYQGMQYWPGEIENVIAELPNVQDVSVVGLYDERCGDKAAAAVVMSKGHSLTEEAIKEHVKKRLPVFYKELHGGVIFVDKLPQNENGKTVKKDVAALFGELNISR